MPLPACKHLQLARISTSLSLPSEPILRKSLLACCLFAERRPRKQKSGPPSRTLLWHEKSHALLSLFGSHGRVLLCFSANVTPSGTLRPVSARRVNPYTRSSFQSTGNVGLRNETGLFTITFSLIHSINNVTPRSSSISLPRPTWRIYGPAIKRKFVSS